MDLESDINVIQLGVDAQLILILSDTGSDWRLQVKCNGITRQEAGQILRDYGQRLLDGKAEVEGAE